MHDEHVQSKEVEPEEITGTDAMRQLVKQRSRKWSLHNLARDLNENVARANQRSAALGMARRLAGEMPIAAVTTVLAKSFASNQPDSAGRENRVSAADLEDFMNDQGSGADGQAGARHDPVWQPCCVRRRDRPDGQHQCGIGDAVLYDYNANCVNPSPQIAKAQAALVGRIQGFSPARSAEGVITPEQQSSSRQPRLSVRPKLLTMVSAVCTKRSLTRR
jgi:hypothetical protein